MSKHVSAICQSCYIHLRNIGKIRQYLTTEATEKLICAFISSKLDYHNSLLFGLPKYIIRRLQLIQNNAARIVSRSSKYDNISPVLFKLHWLPVEYRVKYKIILLTFKSLNRLAPVYLMELLQPYIPSRDLRSGSMNRLVEPQPRTVKYGDRAFSICAPRLWNSLPNDLRCCTSLDSFKKDLKTHLFKKTFKV